MTGAEREVTGPECSDKLNRVSDTDVFRPDLQISTAPAGDRIGNVPDALFKRAVQPDLNYSLRESTDVTTRRDADFSATLMEVDGPKDGGHDSTASVDRFTGDRICDSRLRAQAKPFIPRAMAGATQPRTVTALPEHDAGSKQEQLRQIKEATATARNLDYLQPVIDNLPDDLTAEQRTIAVELIRNNSDVFSRDEFDLGVSDLFTMRIKTYPDARPVC
jgi:hypothetical protein